MHITGQHINTGAGGIAKRPAFVYDLSMGYRDIKHIIIMMLSILLLAGLFQCAFAKDGWNVKSVEFIPTSPTVAMSRILEQDNDGIKALNLANRGSNSRISQSFFASGDKCIVTYGDDSTKEFTFNKKKGVSYAEFKASDGTVINLEALTSDLATELKNSSEVSVDDLAAKIGNNGVTIEYGEYWIDEGDPDYEGDDEVVGNYVRTHATLEVVEDVTHNHSEGVRDRSENPAQCEATGMSHDCVYCQVCGRFFVSKDDFTELDKDDLIIPMLGHAWGEWEEIKPATDTEAGEEQRTCSRCSEKYKKIIPPGTHEHTPGEVQHWKKPSCEHSGIEPHYICTGCAEWIIKNEETGDYDQVEEGALRVPAKGHKEGAPEEGKVKPATCVSTGGYNLTYRCKNCEKVLRTERVVLDIDNNAHQWGNWVKTRAATTKAKGEEKRSCERCKRVETRAIPMIKPAKAVKTVTVNSATVSAKTLNAAVKKAGAGKNTVTTIVLGKKVKKISKGTFKNYKKAKTLIVKTKKLKKSKVKNSLKGSKISRIKVRVGKKKTNKAYVKRYKKIFTKKNAGKKVRVTI